MKLHLNKPGKKVILITSVIALGVLGGVSAQVANKPKAEAGTSPLIQQVDKQGTELDNHEARITNTENDVKDLQGKTNTAPSTVKVPVPVVVSQPSDTTPAPEAPTPVIVTGYEQTTPGGLIQCKLTYSDGTTKSFAAGSMAPGVCDENTIGQPKD